MKTFRLNTPNKTHLVILSESAMEGKAEDNFNSIVEHYMALKAH
jgi:hypothetical protein